MKRFIGELAYGLLVLGAMIWFIGFLMNHFENQGESNRTNCYYYYQYVTVRNFPIGPIYCIRIADNGKPYWTTP